MVYDKDESIQGLQWIDQLGFPDHVGAVLGRIYWRADDEKLLCSPLPPNEPLAGSRPIPMAVRGAKELLRHA
jgi:hypothetical protein